MRKLTILLFLFAALKVSAQEGINFNQTKTWEETLQAAEKSGKLIFVDCYTDWCGPCRWMDANVFVAGPVADYYNATFINMKIDMEKGEGVELGRKYKVSSFPTFLFIDSKGEVVHRTGSRMPMEDFLEEGKNASDPKRRINYLTAQYEGGAVDLPFLYGYYTALARTDRSQADKIGKEITDKITDDQLKTELGWNVIKLLARSETDKLGAFFMANQSAFNNFSKAEERDELKGRLITNSTYGLMRGNNEQAFMEKLAYFKKSDNIELRKQGVMLEASYYLGKGKNEEYIKLTNAAMKNELKDEAENLSFLARSSSGGKGGGELASADILQQAYLMAKRAVELDPTEYSIMGTFTQICLAMKKKEEGLEAARKTVALAEPLGSKIQRLAREQQQKVEAL